MRQRPADLYRPEPVHPEVCSHAYSMDWRPERCRCTACGQTWVLRTDDQGRSLGWTPAGVS